MIGCRIVALVSGVEGGGKCIVELRAWLRLGHAILLRIVCLSGRKSRRGLLLKAWGSVGAVGC